MSINQTIKEQLAIVDVIAPTAAAANTYLSLGVDMARFKHVAYDLNLGAITGAGTLDANLQSAALSNFQTPHNITNSNLTQVVNTGNTTISRIEVRADQVAQQNAGDRYVRLRVVTAVNTVLFGAVGYGLDPAQQPASSFNLNSTYISQEVVVNT